MDIDMDKVFDIVGGKNKYQIQLFFCVCLCWFSVDYIALCFGILLFYPDMKYKNKGDLDWKTIDPENKERSKLWCDIYLSPDKYDIDKNVIYHNLLTELNIYCNDPSIKTIMVVFTLGVIIGAFLASKYADIVGRKMVVIACLISFGLFALIMTLVPIYYLVMVCLFFMGIGSSGGTMVSFVLIYEVLSKEARNVFGTLINSSYSIAGCSYLTVMYFTRHWYSVSILSISISVIACCWIIISFVESPRYLYTSRKFKECFIALLRIAYKNNKLKEYSEFLNEQIFTPSQKEIFEREILASGDPSYISIKNFLKKVDFKYLRKKKYSDDSFPSKTSGATSEEDNQIEVEETLIEDDALQLVENNNEQGFKALCTYPSVRMPFIYCSILWVCVSYIYFGQSFIQKDESAKTIFFNGYTMFGAEFVAYLATGAIMEIKFMGRTRTIGYGGFFTIILGICLGIFVDLEEYTYILLFVFRFLCTAMFTGMYTYCTEVYPTSIRSKGMGLNITFARFSTVVVALTAKKETAYFVFAALAIIVFVIHFFLKETCGVPLEEEIEEIKEKQNHNHGADKINILEEMKDDSN